MLAVVFVMTNIGVFSRVSNAYQIKVLVIGH